MNSIINKNEYTEYISEQLKQYSGYISANNGPIGTSGSCGESGICGPTGISGSCGESGVCGTIGTSDSCGNSVENYNRKLPILEIYEILPYGKIAVDRTHIRILYE